MKRQKSIFGFNHINENLSDSEISELKELYKYYHKKYWLFKTAFKHYKKIELACNIGSAGLVVTGESYSSRDNIGGRIIIENICRNQKL